ncbi:hypothetical protein MON38_08190 [Hymenobacter sp. DH14]|uniref:Uncharacterized protein n=1 Tax=Hymenobacter cyanobacteriorum TaxID=2926463 RepID=A0A9X1VFY5_9BACT|nr:hypothetical protein [Hymenobacter cyanobacteriorum]MCI1187397.1 hypothetical protein [Hymenobacter cyanobacteriorum]
MLPTSRLAVFARAVLLPLLLALAVGLSLGSYFETSDDGTLAWLFAGVLALKPVTSVPLYFHGYGHLLAAAYTAAPAGPWLGLLLAGLLALASALWFAVLERLLRPWLRPGWLTLALVLFFGLGWLEHWLWFSHARVALLLAAGGVLFAAQRPGRRGPLLLGLLALAAAWLVRPGLAVVGAGAVLPAARLLAGSCRRAAPVLVSAAVGLLLATAILRWQQTPAETRAQRRDALFSQMLDFNQLRPQPRTPADSLGTAAISRWLLGDSTVVNEAMVQRAYHFDATDFLTREVPAKLRQRLPLLARDYFPMLLALAASAVAMARRRGRAGWFWLVQMAFGGGLLLLAGLLKLPPRLALPLLDCWLLTNLVFWLQAARLNDSAEDKNAATEASKVAATASAAEHPGSAFSSTAQRPGPAEVRKPQLHLQPLPRFFSIALLLAVVSLYVAKTWHRHQVLQQEQRRHESALAALGQQAGQVRVLAGTNDWLKSLSPFRTYSPGPGPVLLLTGWPAHDASQAALRQSLSGTADQTECLRRLANRPVIGTDVPVLWLLSPETAAWLSRRTAFDGPRLLLTPQRPLPSAAPDSAVWLYQAALQLKKM